MTGFIDPNIAQRQASDPKASVWVAANAGTGKTKVLTDRVLSLMVTGTKPHHILCLTFTKAAAAEMANRIADQLGKWSIMGNDELTASLQDLLTRSPEEDEFTLARQLFAHVLDAPGGLQIQTIHAFCQSLLRRFPLEAGLAPHFQVMDERNAAELLKKAQDDILMDARLGRTPELYEALRAVTNHIHETAFPELMGALAGERGRLRRVLDHHGGVRKLITRLAELMELSPTDTPERIIERACEQDSFDALGLRVAMDALLAGSKTDQARGDVLAQWMGATQAERLSLFDDYKNAYLTAGGDIRKTLITKTAASQSPGAVDVLSVEAERMLRTTTKIRASVTLQTTNGLLRIGKCLLDAYDKYKQGTATLDYDDLILKTRDLLTKETVPWVLYKLDGGIEHVLVDEAQDTNPDQWRVIEALTQEFFVGEGTHEEENPRTIFAVGDVKQSIYSFQGADPAEFERMKHHFGDHVPQSHQDWREIPMTMSFRSTRAVLQCVDAIFSDPAIAQGVEIDDEIHHDAWRAKDGGLVELWPPIIPTAAAPVTPWKPPIERIQADSPRARLAQMIARRIQHMVLSQEKLEAKGRPIEPGDIMVLVRRRSGFVEELVRSLKELNIAVAGVDRMILSEQMAVMDLVALGRFLLQPDDDLQLACVLKGPLLGLNDDDLFNLSYQRKGSLWSALRDKANDDLHYLSACNFLKDLMARTDYVRPFELFTYVLSAREGRKKIISRLGLEADDPINEFLDLALQYERSHTPSLEGFLAWLDTGETEVKRDLEQASQNAVRVMTVHGAKGLQAPIVFMPDTLQAPAKGEKLLWPHDPETGDELFIWPPKSEFYENISKAEKDRLSRKRDEEYRRLLYVALTRAEDRLYVCGWETKRAAPAHCWYNLIKNGLAKVGEEVDDIFINQSDETDEVSVLRLKCDQEIEAKIEPGFETQAYETIPLPDWAKTNPGREPSPPRPLAPSRPTEPEPATRSPLGTDHGYRYKRGNIIHALLQTLPELAAEEREDAAISYLARPNHGLDENQQSDICAETLRILSDEEFSDVFGEGSQAEVPIVGEVHGRVISAQVDRLLVRSDEIIVVDYKTNRPPPRSVKKVPTIYINQMKAYRAALQLIYPDKPVRCVLLWTDTPKLMEIPTKMLE
ncbi:ATP-dependent nuclease subunit A [Candidatus Terasakiella magnetica]|uniref:DNA 3'-5' helicase n=1 Tax=Candidatus Terasakiella magnetica TaxID=1867952 RepID=A0A1C3RGQ4_9PROT|nr:double-strand break repair helicase AddA [Candidatus Terasakiella magnetica]SCA56451.1 ATP-dependent nuclease subunit A [Candidatus Terasakiella magnetica]